jgi:hypothetical protein
MPANVVVTAFSTNPAPPTVNNNCDLQFSFQNNGDQVTADDHGVQVNVTKINGAANAAPAGTLNVTLSAGQSRDTSLAYQFDQEGTWAIDAVPEEGTPFQTRVDVV